MTTIHCCCCDDDCWHRNVLRRTLGAAVLEARCAPNVTAHVAVLPGDQGCRLTSVNGELTEIEFDREFLEHLDEDGLQALLAGDDETYTEDREEDEEHEDQFEDDLGGEAGDTESEGAEYGDGDEDDGDEENEDEEWAVATSPDEKLERVLARLAFAIPGECQIEVESRGDINGWTDGERITLTSGAVEDLPEGALAALVAHELAHIHERHLQHHRALGEAIADSLVGTWRVKGGGVAKKLVVTLATAGASLVGSRLFSQFQELDADAAAVHLLREAGYSLDDARDLEQRLSGAGGLLSTHPSQQLRLRLLDYLDDE